MKRSLMIFFIVFCFSGFAENILTDSEADDFNQTIIGLKDQVREKFQKAQEWIKSGETEEKFKVLLKDVRILKSQIAQKEEEWRTALTQNGEGESYALWDVGETTVAGLVMEYGASDYLYVIPAELASMKLSLYTSIPLPRESWSEMIDAILGHNGVGVKKINTYVKQLYISKLDPSAIEGIVDREDKLDFFANHSRIFYVLSPPVEQLKAVQSFFERFSDPKQTTVQAIGAKVVIVSTKETVDKLLGLYHAVWEKNGGKTVRVVSLTKIQPAEAEKVLKAVFTDAANRGRPTFYPSSADELISLNLPQGLVLVGEAGTVERAERILTDLESQLEDPGEKVIYWYACKHSDPQDIAEVLGKVYDSLTGSNFEKKVEPATPPPPPLPPTPPQEPNGAQIFPPPSNAYNPTLPAQAPSFIQPGTIEKQPQTNFTNFIVDNKSTSVLMVVKREELPKIKALLKKLDVPKRMVQLDVLLVEKKLTDRKQVGINLLEFGANSSGIKRGAFAFNTEVAAVDKGILSFLFSKNKTSTPAANLVYNFLLAQDDVQINANPSVLAINQTPATVSIVDEISINNGAIQLNTQAGVTVEKSFTRAQYGITIVLTPTIHLSDPEDTDANHPGFVSLQTNLEFDTTRMTENDRPPVTRRHVENQVCVADGETVILGGLRQKIEEDSREKIPFLSDIPGFGKLFGKTKITDINTEMFIFITPHIIRDPVDDLRQIRLSEYQKRAGDIPEFLERIDEAKERARSKLFENSLKMLFDMY